MTEQSQFSLLKQRRFAPFFWVQFLGAFNDNVYKNALVILLAFQVGSLSAQESNTLINLSAGLFILPFFLFSATSGQLADKYEKSRLIRYVVSIELGLMCLGAFGFYWKSVALLMFTLFLGAYSRHSSGRSNMRSCRSISSPRRSSAATAWSRWGPSSPSSSAPSSAACSSPRRRSGPRSSRSRPSWWPRPATR